MILKRRFLLQNIEFSSMKLLLFCIYDAYFYIQEFRLEKHNTKISGQSEKGCHYFFYKNSYKFMKKSYNYRILWYKHFWIEIQDFVICFLCITQPCICYKTLYLVQTFLYLVQDFVVKFVTKCFVVRHGKVIQNQLKFCNETKGLFKLISIACRARFWSQISCFVIIL